MGEQLDIDAIRPEVQAALGSQATLVTALNGMLEVGTRSEIAFALGPLNRYR
jgi:hypothetical protein